MLCVGVGVRKVGVCWFVHVFCVGGVLYVCMCMTDHQ